MDDLKRFFTLGHVADHVRGVTLKGGAKDGRKLIRTDDGGHLDQEVVPEGVWTRVEETEAAVRTINNRITTETTRLDGRITSEAERLDGRIDQARSDLETDLNNTAVAIRDEMAADKEELEEEIAEVTDKATDEVEDRIKDKFAPKLVVINPDSNDSTDSNDEQVELSELAVLTFNTTQNHLTDFDNPHQVTKVQVGLGNVDNTSDMDKPVSTATMTEIEKISKALLNNNNPTIGEIASVLGWSDQ